MEYYIFGASKLGSIAFSALKDDYNIIGFLDNNKEKHSKEFCGKKIYNPEVILNTQPQVIIASQYYEEIESQIRAHGIENYKIFKISLEDVCINFSSNSYWEERYRHGGNSGTGSYDHLAEFKAKVINEFIESQNINIVCEWGVGDGNQLTFMKYPSYVGYDISQTAIKMCEELFKKDLSKTFIKYDGKRVSFNNKLKYDLAISLDVIYHLVEDEIYEVYMENLFESSSKYICIYSTNYNSHHVPHVKDREILSYIFKNYKNWKLINYIENEYLPEKIIEKNLESSNCNFYFFEKTG